MTTFYKNLKLKALLSNAVSFAGLVWPSGDTQPFGLASSVCVWGRGCSPCSRVAWPAGDKSSSTPHLGCTGLPSETFVGYGL